MSELALNGGYTLCGEGGVSVITPRNIFPDFKFCFFALQNIFPKRSKAYGRGRNGSLIREAVFLVVVYQ